MFQPGRLARSKNSINQVAAHELKITQHGSAVRPCFCLLRFSTLALAASLSFSESSYRRFGLVYISTALTPHTNRSHDIVSLYLLPGGQHYRILRGSVFTLFRLHFCEYMCLMCELDSKWEM